jgi:hypothetical protein
LPRSTSRVASAPCSRRSCAGIKEKAHNGRCSSVSAAEREPHGPLLPIPLGESSSPSSGVSSATKSAAGTDPFRMPASERWPWKPTSFLWRTIRCRLPLPGGRCALSPARRHGIFRRVPLAISSSPGSIGDQGSPYRPAREQRGFMRRHLEVHIVLPGKRYGGDAHV